MSGNKDSGKEGTPLSASQLCASTENSDLFCHPCDEDHRHVEACGFCVKCEDYLCGDCVQFHKQSRSTKNHVIQDKDSMSKDFKPHKDICTEPCTEHYGKVMEYYCESHKKILCSVCITLEHKDCGVGYIPKLAKGIMNSKDYEQMIVQIDSLKTSFKETNDTTLKSIAEVESESKVFTDKVNKFGQDIIKHVEYLMKKALKEKDEFVQKLIVQLNNSKTQCEKMIKEINSMQAKFESKTNSDIESFILMKEHPANIKEIQETLEKRQIDSKPTVFQLAENVDLQFVKETETIGTLMKYKKVAKKLDEINIPTEGKKKIPWITGMEVLSDKRLAIVDNNQSVSLIDTKDNHVTETQLKEEPWGITEISKGQLAVTLPKINRIQFLIIKDKTVTIKNFIKTDGWCMGIAAHQNKLIVGVVGTPAGEVQILDLSGRVLRRITTGENGEKLFSRPCSIAVSPSNSLIYVSDSRKKTLTCVTLEGEVKFVYSDEDMDEPRGVAIDTDGSVFVCGSDSIEHITGEGRKIQTLLDSGLKGAHSFNVAYNKNSENIFLGSFRKKLHVYLFE